MAQKKNKVESNDTITVAMQIEKETKNTFRYKEILKNEFDRPMLGTLYLPKDICKGAQTIGVAIVLNK